MPDIVSATILAVVLFALLASGLWIGLALLGVGTAAMLMFTNRPLLDSMATSIWGGSIGWSLTALPLFIWMGEILFRTRLTKDMFRALAPWTSRLPGRLLHVNVVGCAIFAAVSGSSAATCATIARVTYPELRARGYPDSMTIGSLAGAGTLGLLIPPSIMMIVYGVAADVSITELFIAGVVPGILLAALFSGYVAVWASFNPELIPAADPPIPLMARLRGLQGLAPIALLIASVLGSIYAGLATATESAAVGVICALFIAWLQGGLDRRTFEDCLLGAVHTTAMIALILAGSAFLTLSMGYTGLPRHLAAWITALDLPAGLLILALTLLFIFLGCFLDGISMIVLTLSVLLPTVTAAGIDLLWFGVFIIIVVEMAQITPPVGFNLFVLQGMTEKPIGHIARVSIPFFFLMVAMVLVITLIPELVTWLPAQMRR